MENKTRYMRELRCALADIFTHCGTNTTRKKNLDTSNISIGTSSVEFEYSSKPRKVKKIESVIPTINYEVESGTDRTLAFGVTVKDVVWMIDRLNEFGYEVISVTQDPNIWKPKRDISTRTVWVMHYYYSNYYCFKVRKIEEVDLLV